MMRSEYKLASDGYVEENGSVIGNYYRYADGEVVIEFRRNFLATSERLRNIADLMDGKTACSHKADAEREW